MTAPRTNHSTGKRHCSPPSLRPSCDCKRFSSVPWPCVCFHEKIPDDMHFELPVVNVVSCPHDDVWNGIVESSKSEQNKWAFDCHPMQTETFLCSLVCGTAIWEQMVRFDQISKKMRSIPSKTSRSCIILWGVIGVSSNSCRVALPNFESFWC